ncbi:MAG: hypothetical protein WCD80_00485 [Desulfobaccales bacterium]
MRSKRFLYSKKPSKCCSYKALLVQSREGGFISQNCLQCGKPDYVSPENLPDLLCDFCESDLSVEKLDNKNYFYACNKCKRNWKIADILRHWAELFEKSGLAAYGEITK